MKSKSKEESDKEKKQAYSALLMKFREVDPAGTRAMTRIINYFRSVVRGNY